MTSNAPNGNPKNDDDKNDQGSLKNKFKDSYENLKKNDKVEGLVNYAKSNTRDTIAYVLLITGILLLFFEPWYGGTLVGVIFGLYFSNEILDLIQNYESYIDQHGIVKFLVFGGLLLAFFITAPFIFIGAAVAVGLKFLLVTGDKPK